MTTCGSDTSFGLEPAFSLYYKGLVEPGHISAMKLIDLMTRRPAKIVNLGEGRGSLAVGAAADITVIDPATKWTVDVSQFKSKSRNCPFDGWKLQGRPVCTIVGGEVKWRVDE